MSEGPALTITEHLEELRGRLIICVIGLVIATIACFFVAEPALVFLSEPLEGLGAQRRTGFLDLTLHPDGALTGELPADVPRGFHHVDDLPIRMTVIPVSGEPVVLQIGERPESRLYYFNVTDPFFLLIKAALLLGLLTSSPLILWQTWLFVAPGLTKRERGAVKPMLWLSLLLFPLGAAFGYFILHTAVIVLTNFAFGGMQLLPDTARYVSFALTMMIAFGLIFEMPTVLLLLNRLGLVSVEWMIKYRRHAICASFLVAAILTPPDVFTQVAMAIPMVLLYQLSIWLARVGASGGDA